MGELARGHEDERAGVRGVAAGFAALHDLMDRGEEVGGGFAAAGVRARHHVLALEHKRDGARLHGSRRAVPLLRERAEEPGVEPEGVPARVALVDSHRGGSDVVGRRNTGARGVARRGALCDAADFLGRRRGGRAAAVTTLRLGLSSGELR